MVPYARGMRCLALLGLVLPTLAGCGGKVVFVGDTDGGGGNGGASTSLSVTVSATSTSSSSSSIMAVGGGGPGLVEEIVGTSVTDGPFAVELTPQTLGLQAVAHSQTELGELYFTSLTAPSGAQVVGDTLPSNGWQWAWYGTLAMLTPQVGHPETFPMAQGTWTFGFSSAASSDVSVWRRSTIDGGFHGGVLDVNVFIADDWVGQDDTLDALVIAYDDWGGIELGDVRFYAIGAEYLSVDENNLFSLLMETAAAETRPALNLLAVAEITGQISGAAGFSNGIPGAPLNHGSESSGVVWMVQFDDFYDSIILRHEAAHFAGLFHTSEFEPGLGDPLDDTPFCPDVEAQMDQCPDYDYIMFPTGGSGAGTISAQESKVLQGGAIYRGVYAPGEPPMTAYGPPLLDGGQSSGRMVTAWEMAAARARVAARRASFSTSRQGRGARAAWAHSVSAQAAVWLEGIGCPQGATRTFSETLEDLGLVDVDVTLDLARDPSSPTNVRRRTAAHAAYLWQHGFATQAEVAQPLADISADVGAPGPVRAAALRALVDVDPIRAGVVGAALAADGDRLVRRASAATR